jgi:hypothetical protein
MPISNITRAEAYYKSMNNKNLSEMAEYLHPDIQFLSPLAQLKGKEAFLEAAEKLMTLFISLTIRAKFSSEDQVMLAYDFDFPEPIGMIRTAALLTFENTLITHIELFFDPNPFIKNWS